MQNGNLYRENVPPPAYQVATLHHTATTVTNLPNLPPERRNVRYSEEHYVNQIINPIVQAFQSEICEKLKFALERDKQCKIKALRDQLTYRRWAFLDRMLDKNVRSSGSFCEMELSPYGNPNITFQGSISTDRIQHFEEAIARVVATAEQILPLIVVEVHRLSVEFLKHLSLMFISLEFKDLATKRAIADKCYKYNLTFDDDLFFDLFFKLVREYTKLYADIFFKVYANHFYTSKGKQITFSEIEPMKFSRVDKGIRIFLFVDAVRSKP
jgi:hypothetical protein